MAGLWLSVGNLNNGVGNAGLSCVNANNGLSNGNWNILARISEIKQIIIRAQAGMLEMHGIETDNGTLESDRAKLLADVEGSI